MLSVVTDIPTRKALQPPKGSELPETELMLSRLCIADGASTRLSFAALTAVPTPPFAPPTSVAAALEKAEAEARAESEDNDAHLEEYPQEGEEEEEAEEEASDNEGARGDEDGDTEMAEMSPSPERPGKDKDLAEHLQLHTVGKVASPRLRLQGPFGRLRGACQRLQEEHVEASARQIYGLPVPVIRLARSEFSRMQSARNIAKAPLDTLLDMVEVLQRQVQEGLGENAIAVMVVALEAAIALMRLLTTVGAPRQILTEDVINDVIQLTDNVVKRTTSDSGAKKRPSTAQMHKAGELLDLLAELLTSVVQTDAVVCRITSVALPLLFCESTEALQLRAIAVLCSVFGRYDAHRGMIFQDLFHSLDKLPTGKRGLRKYRVETEGKVVFIQVISAAVLLMLQSCGRSSDGTSWELNGYEAASASAKVLLTLFIQKFTTKATAWQVEYRAILENLTQDFLLVAHLPHWPMAEVLLSVLSGMYLSALAQQGKQAKTLEGLRKIATQQLGAVATKLRQEASHAKECRLFSLAPKDDSEEQTQGSCSCGQVLVNRFMLSCERCGTWFHGECMGVDPNNVPSEWHCRPCRTILRALESVGEMSEDEERLLAAARKVVLHYLQSQSRLQREASHAFYFWQCWDRGEETKATFVAPAGPVPSLTTAIAAVRFLTRRHELALSFNAILNKLLALLSDRQMAFRTAGVRALASVVEADPSLLGLAKVHNAVCERRLDLSVSVRQAVIDLVSSFILYRPEYAQQYYAMVIDRIADTGKSVRKRVVKTLRRICLEQPDSAVIIEICGKLVGRLNDEKPIRALVLKTFRELWFTDLTVPVVRKDGTRVRGEADVRLAARVNQILAVIRHDSSDRQWFVDMVKDLLREEEEAENAPVLQETAADMVGHIVDRIIRLEEEGEAAGDALSSGLSESIALLSLFSRVRPSLLENHALTLLPYLHPSRGLEAVVLVDVIDVLERALARIYDVSTPTLETLEEDLSQLIKSHTSMKVVHACIRTLCVLVRKTEHEGIVVGLKNASSAFLSRQPPPRQVPPIMRCLFNLGHFHRYFDFDSHENERSAMEGGPSSTKRDLRVLLKYSSLSQPQPVLLKALQGLGNLFIRAPGLMPSCKGLLGACLKHEGHLVRAQVLTQFIEFLDVERKIGSDDHDEREGGEEEESNDGPPALHDGSDQGARALQSCLPAVMTLLRDQRTTVRMLALRTVDALLRHGLAHPAHCAGAVIVLLADETPGMHERVVELLRLVQRKCPGMLHSRVADGMRQAYAFQREVCGYANALRVSPSSNSALESVFSPLFSLVTAKRQRLSFIDTALHLIVETAQAETYCDGAFITYLANAVAFLPFALTAEPLHVVSSANRIVNVRTSVTAQQLSTAIDDARQRKPNGALSSPYPQL